MGASSLIQQSNHGTMVEREEDEESLGSLSSFSNGDCDSFMDEVISSSSSSSSSSSDKEPIFEMSSLMVHLPIKRGLSRHYRGKSQSFTSLSNVCCLEDLVKPERLPCRKKLKTSRSCGGGLDSQKLLSPKGCFGAVSKKGSRSSLASLSARRHGFLGTKPPVPPPQRLLA